KWLEYTYSSVVGTCTPDLGQSEAVVPAFSFQAEDGIRDFHVTGVQTCALPISDLAHCAACAQSTNYANRPDTRTRPVQTPNPQVENFYHPPTANLVDVPIQSPFLSRPAYVVSCPENRWCC